MTWTLEYRDRLQIVVLTYSGKVTGPDIKEAAAARIDLGKQKGVTRFLIDTREVEADESATMSIYDIPAKIYGEEYVQRSNHLAILGPKSLASREMVKFFENVCVNRGWIVKTFEDYESALAWLERGTFEQETESDD